MRRWVASSFVAFLATTAHLAAAEVGDPPRMHFADTVSGHPFSKDPAVVRFKDRYWLYYSLPAYQGKPTRGWSIGIAASDNLVDWRKAGELVNTGDAEANGFAAPGAIVLQGRIHLFYQSYGNGPRDAICHAWSDDGLNFTRNSTNPIFRPTGDWNNGRAIDADVIEHDGRLLLYWATRDPGHKIQMLGVAAAAIDSDFARDKWTQLSGDGPILKPELPWEHQCIEAAAMAWRGGRLYMFYAGGYNNQPQQIGVAVSDDGIRFSRLSEEPFLCNGPPESWNSSESGHPYLFQDDDGRDYLFHQGNSDGGRTWHLSVVPIDWKDCRPVLSPERPPPRPREASASREEKGDALCAPARMPRVEDYTHTWWAEGFPAHSPGAPWRRVVQSGYYAFALDTDTLRIPHFGPVPDGVDYLAAARADNGAWRRLPPAELGLSITADGETYWGTAGGKWTEFTGPRLIESGRFLQRADVTDLVFTARDGTELSVDARLETVAWPDRLALILAARPRSSRRKAAMEIRLTAPQGTLSGRWEPAEGRAWESSDWQEASLAMEPATFRACSPTSVVGVRAYELSSNSERPVQYDAARGWHRVDLDGIMPLAPAGEDRRRLNDAIERVGLVLSNPTDREQPARLLFAKNGSGIRHRIGSPITGMSAILRDRDGNPSGIPVQFSKNWHGRPEGGVYAGTWFHGFSLVRLPPRAEIELELTIVYGHWGGVAAASHAQLCIVGWGSNQLWDQSALGSWGESICYEPDQIQAQAAILDVRPVMVRSMHADQPWHWTHNVGGGDYFRLFEPGGGRVPHARMRAAYQRYGPCLTEVTYAGRIGQGLEHSATVSLGRTDDIVRGTYRLRLDVDQATNFSRFVIFQIGADTYSYTGERKMALGNEAGLMREWETQWGGEKYRGEPIQCIGRVPWVSLHEAVARRDATNRGAWANRGFVIRSWRARLGGNDAAPWIAERGVRARGVDTSTLDLLPPPGVARLEPGDFVEATIEHLVVPQFAADYYGPNEALRAALTKNENTWRLIHREAVGNDRRVEMATGDLETLHPAIAVKTVGNAAKLTLHGGIGFVPIAFGGLASPRGHALYLNNTLVDQSIHGNDFWQTDYDAATQCWSRTYNVLRTEYETCVIELRPAK